MVITIGAYVYLLIKSCDKNLGAVGYTRDDSHRQLVVCTDYGKEQTKEIFTHEVMHACIHNHPHNFKTDEELKAHILEIPQNIEEPFVSNLAHCIVQAEDNKEVKTYLGLE